MEYEASSNVMDLRYVPEGETFEDQPHSVARDVPPDYTSPFFTNNALGHTKVRRRLNPYSLDPNPQLRNPNHALSTTPLGQAAGRGQAGGGLAQALHTDC